MGTTLFIDTRPLRHVGSWLRSPWTRTAVLYAPLVLLSTTSAAVTWSARDGAAPATMSDSGMLLWLFGLCMLIPLALRRQWPVTITVGLALAPLVLPLDPVPALVALGSLAVRRADRVVGAVGGLVLLATGVSIWRDSRGRLDTESFWQGMRGPGAHDPLPLWTVGAIALVLVGVTLGISLLVRARAQISDSQAAVAQQRSEMDVLTGTVARQAERERIAREIHDALGHRLSLLSLHAGALEVASAQDDELHRSAQLVRRSAQEAMQDLRALLEMVRRPPVGGRSLPGLDALARLVDESLAAGAPLVASVHVEGPEGIDPEVGRGAYRIVQELLTNARRHAPGIGVRLLVRADPGRGVVIEAANAMPPGAAPPRPGHGLSGMGERVAQLGGDARWWVDERAVFRVAVRLPPGARPDHHVDHDSAHRPPVRTDGSP